MDRNHSNLEKGQEVVQLLSLGTFVEAHPTCVKQDANESNSEEVIRHIDRTWLAR